MHVDEPAHALITGASSGIGAALALAYARPGALLTLGGRNTERLAEVAAQATARGATVATATFDVRDRDAAADWVVASDGGAGHLCSLAVPILSIFGGSPFRRYAPFGRRNRLMTQELPCSPCCQYMSRAINGCLSIECLVGITPRQVLASATRDAATCMKLDADVGTLEPNKWADFVVLDADPLADISNVRKISSVWISGNRVIE